MSGAGTAKKPKHRFCWACSRQLQGNFHRVVKGPDGREHVVHAECARKDHLEVIPGASRKDGKRERRG
jgi:hypothetical protein